METKKRKIELWLAEPIREEEGKTIEEIVDKTVTNIEEENEGKAVTRYNYK